MPLSKIPAVRKPAGFLLCDEGVLGERPPHPQVLEPPHQVAEEAVARCSGKNR